MLKTASLKKKLMALCVVLTAMTSAVGGISYLVTRDITSNYRHISEVTLKNSEALRDMAGSFKEIRIALRTIGLEGLSDADRRQAIADAQKWIASYEESNKAYQSISFAPGEREIYEALAKSWDEFKGVGARILKLAEADTPEAQSALSQIFLKDCPEAAAKFRAAMETLMGFQAKEAASRVEKATVTAERGNATMVLFSILAPLCGLGFGLVFSNRLARILKRLADGLSNGAGEVNGAAEQISAAGDALSSTSTEQAAALQQTVASLDEVSAMVNRNAENAKRSREAAMEGRESALRGKRSMDEMRQAIDDINASNEAIKNQVEASNQEISNIVKIIAEIGDKTKIINDIVFQTKLLSFNASVEAARAGEHGKGFAVVAEEVGNLAQMSGNAAREISQMLEASIKKVEATVQETKSRVEGLIVAGQGKVEAGSEIALRCGATLDGIVKSVEGLSQMVAEIATASSEQAQGVEQINKAMTHLDKVAQQNVATSQQAAGAALQLNAQAAGLRDIVAELVRTVDGALGKEETSVAEGAKTPEATASVLPFPRKAA